MAKEKLLSMLPAELDAVYRRILFYEQEDAQYYPIKCAEEVKAGNREFVKAMESTLEALRTSELPEVAYFMRHYMEAYNKTLDEMN